MFCSLTCPDCASTGTKSKLSGLLGTFYQYVKRFEQGIELSLSEKCYDTPFYLRTYFLKDKNSYNCVHSKRSGSKLVISLAFNQPVIQSPLAVIRSAVILIDVHPSMTFSAQAKLLIRHLSYDFATAYEDINQDGQ